jgi:hypothetical protein
MQTTRALAVAGMVGAVVAVIALFIEYQYAGDAGDDSALRASPLTP